MSALAIRIETTRYKFIEFVMDAQRVNKWDYESLRTKARKKCCDGAEDSAYAEQKP